MTDKKLIRLIGKLEASVISITRLQHYSLYFAIPTEQRKKIEKNYEKSKMNLINYFEANNERRKSKTVN